MAVSAFQYGLYNKSAWNKEVGLLSGNVKVMLVTSAYTFAQDTHQYKSSVTNEVTGTGYTAGGIALGSPQLIYTAGTNTLILDGLDTVWAGSTITARAAILYDSTTGSPTTQPLICFVDFGADQVSSGGNFSIIWDPAGIIAITVA